MRWLEPAFPTYQEPLSRYPTITAYSQFGYGKRVCQGQGVVDADMFVALGSIAWLFSLHTESDAGDKFNTTTRLSTAEQQRTSYPKHAARSPGKLTRHGNDSAISIASSVAGYSSSASDSAVSMGGGTSLSSVAWSEDGEVEDLDPNYPSCWMLDADSARREQEDGSDALPGPWVRVAQASKHDASTKTSTPNPEQDPTLKYSSLLIAKPLPFKFQLRIRDQARADEVTRLWSEHKAKGDFEDARVFWEGGVHGNAECG